jgi:hypothetical protein
MYHKNFKGEHMDNKEAINDLRGKEPLDSITALAQTFLHNFTICMVTGKTTVFEISTPELGGAKVTLVKTDTVPPPAPKGH